MFVPSILALVYSPFRRIPCDVRFRTNRRPGRVVNRTGPEKRNVKIGSSLNLLFWVEGPAEIVHFPETDFLFLWAVAACLVFFIFHILIFLRDVWRYGSTAAAAVGSAAGAGARGAPRKQPLFPLQKNTC
ncbi:unnamed protein product [Ectocarpus sp. 13 AM-2016]